MAAAGYRVGELPPDSDALMARLLARPDQQRAPSPMAARDCSRLRPIGHFLRRPAGRVRASKSTRAGGGRSAIPSARHGAFRAAVASLRQHAVVAIQPARGYNIDPAASYHDPALVPPHGYLAFYAWLREEFDAHAVVHMGKHGNLEWLPGKALALSEECWPEAALGPLPQLYPFIVNDPGEGSAGQAPQPRPSSSII